MRLVPATISQGRNSYDQPRPRMHSLIERIDKTRCYRATDVWVEAALSLHPSQVRLQRPALTALCDPRLPRDCRLRRGMVAFDREFQRWWECERLAARD